MHAVICRPPAQNYLMMVNFKVDANPPATIEWIKNLNTDQEEVIGGII